MFTAKTTIASNTTPAPNIFCAVLSSRLIRASGWSRQRPPIEHTNFPSGCHRAHGPRKPRRLVEFDEASSNILCKHGLPAEPELLSGSGEHLFTSHKLGMTRYTNCDVDNNPPSRFLHS